MHVSVVEVANVELAGVDEHGAAYTEGSLSFISCPRRDASQPAAKIGRRKYKTYISFWCVYVHAMFFGNSSAASTFTTHKIDMCQDRTGTRCTTHTMCGGNNLRRRRLACRI